MPDPGGDGALLFRVSRQGVVDELESYGGGHFLSVDADAQGHPVVAGRFQSEVDFGSGPATHTSPTAVVVAKLNL